MKSKNALRLAVLCAVVSACSVPVMAAPATNPPGQGLGVAIGAGSNAQRDGVVAIGKNAHTNYAGGSGYANVNGDVAIGENATTHSYYDQSGSVAIGKNSYVENTIGQQDKLFAIRACGTSSLPTFSWRPLASCAPWGRLAWGPGCGGTWTDRRRAGSSSAPTPPGRWPSSESPA